MVNPRLKQQKATSFEPANTIVLIGDSTTALNNYNNGLVPPNLVLQQSVTLDCGIFTLANIMMGAPFEVLSNAGIPSNTTADVLGRLQRDVIALAPGYCDVLIGINDVSGNRSAAYIIGNLKAIYDRLINAGIYVTAYTLFPNNTVNGVAAWREVLAAVNNWILSYGNNTPGMEVIDIFQATYDPTTYCGANSANFGVSDGTHQSTLGASRYAAYIVANRKKVPKSKMAPGALKGGAASATYPYGNLLGDYSSMVAGDNTTALNSGNGMTFTGYPAAQWWLQGNGDTANCSVTHTFPARTDKVGKSWWNMAFTWTSAQAAIAYFAARLRNQAILPSSVVAGDIIDIDLEMQYINVTNGGGIEIYLQFRDANSSPVGVLPGSSGSGAFQYGYGPSYATPSLSGVVPMRGIVVPANATKFTLVIGVRNAAGTNGNCTLRIGDINVRKRLPQ